MVAADGREYERRIRAWTLYDWANSAFATTVLAAVLPYYYSAVAGASLPSKAAATGYWSTGLTISLIIVAVLSPILGTISDVMRGKKRFLSIAAGIGILATGLLVLVDTGDWLLASILFIIGRVGFAAANVFYDAMLPHIAREEDQDRVSTRGYATGYLGGGLLLAINVALLVLLEDQGTWGPRLCFVSVAVWWAVFSIPLLRRVPEPATAAARLGPGQGILSTSFRQLAETFRQLKRFRELSKFLVAFVIYNDGIGTIITVAVIYVAELGFGMMEAVGAILLVQFVGIPYALIFGRIPGRDEPRKASYLAFVIFNLVMLPLVGIFGAQLLPAGLTGRSPSAADVQLPYVTEGEHSLEDSRMESAQGWKKNAQAEMPPGAASPYFVADGAAAPVVLHFHGRKVKLILAEGPDYGAWKVSVDGKPLRPIDTWNVAPRVEEEHWVDAGEVGKHELVLEPGAPPDERSTGTRLAIARYEVFARDSNLLAIMGLLFVLQLVALAFAWLAGPTLFGPLAALMNTKRTILLSLAAYMVIAAWGYILDAVIEFWFLAWMVAVVQGGSQALSRSLYAYMSPASRSGEFFGFFTVMSKFSAIFGPLLFAAWALTTHSSRPAILSLVLFFVVGAILLTRVDVEEGHRVAREADK